MIKRSVLIFGIPLLGTFFYLFFSDIVFSERHSFDRKIFSSMQIRPAQVVEITVFGKPQTELSGTSTVSDQQFKKEIESKEKFIEKLFFPFLWYEFKLTNKLHVATSTPELREVSDIELKCIDLRDSIKIGPGETKNFWTQLSVEADLRFGCHISEVQGDAWQEFKKSQGVVEVNFGGTLRVEWKLLAISQIFTFLLFFLVIALPTTVLVVWKSFKVALS